MKPNFFPCLLIVTQDPAAARQEFYRLGPRVSNEQRQSEADVQEPDFNVHRMSETGRFWPVEKSERAAKPRMTKIDPKATFAYLAA